MPARGQAVVLGAFFLSGLAGLVQEIAWTRLLGPFLGTTAHAQAVVLAVFMGGLAVGSALFGRRADRARSPARLYAALEIAVGLYGFALPAIVRGAGAIYTAIAVTLPEDASATRGLLRLALATATLLVPSVLMGGTLPVLSRHAVRRLGETGARVGELYTANTFGAVAGAALGGFVLLERVGIAATIGSASALLLAIGVGVWLLLRGAELPPAEVSEPPGTVPRPANAAAPLGALAASGFAALLYEVVMARAVGLSLGSSTYAFTMMLIAFIVGIGLGSFVVSRLSVERPLAALGWSQLAAGLAFLAVTPLLGRLPYFASLVRCHCFPLEERFFCYQGLGTLLVLAVLLVPTACLGAAFPLVAQATARSVGSVGSRVGWAYACNTLGNVGGAVVASLVLLPVVGLGHTLEIGVGLNLVAAILVLAGTASRREQGAAVGLMIVAAGAYLPVRGWPDGLTLTALHFRLRQDPPRSYTEFLARYSFAETKRFLGEDAGATVLAAPVGRDVSLFVNGKPDASATSDLTTQKLLAHVPLFLARRAQTVLTVGYGSGITAGSVLRHPVVREDIVEISPAVLRADQVFRRWNGGVLADPRVHVYLDDARSFIRVTPRRYEVIISEPSNPWVAGVAGLFSREFFRDARARLAPGGVLCVWFHEYEQSTEAVEMVVRTLAAELPEISVWREYHFTDMILVASERPLEVDFAEMERRFEIVRGDVSRMGIPSLAALLAHNAITPAEIRRALRPGPLHTDLRPRLEFLAARAALAADVSYFGWEHDLHFKTPDGRETDLLFDQYLRWRREQGRPLRRAEIEQVRVHLATELQADHTVLRRFSALAARAPE